MPKMQNGFFPSGGARMPSGLGKEAPSDRGCRPDGQNVLCGVCDKRGGDGRP